jgi:hypothetical protein
MFENNEPSSEILKKVWNIQLTLHRDSDEICLSGRYSIIKLERTISRPLPLWRLNTPSLVLWACWCVRLVWPASSWTGHTVTWMSYSTNYNSSGKAFLSRLDAPFRSQWLLHILPRLILKILRSAKNVHYCFLNGSQKKQRLFSYTNLTEFFLQPRRCVLSSCYELGFEIWFRLVFSLCRFDHEYGNDSRPLNSVRKSKCLN